MIGIVAMQEPQRRIVVDDAETERLRKEAQTGIEVARVEIDVDDLARPVGNIARIGMVGAIADESEVAAVGILAGKAVAATRRVKPCRLLGPIAGGGDPCVQGVDAVAVGDIEDDAHDGGLRAVTQAEYMMIGAGAAKVARVVACFDRRQAPHDFVKPRRLVEIAGDKLDASHPAHKTGRHKL